MVGESIAMRLKLFGGTCALPNREINTPKIICENYSRRTTSLLERVGEEEAFRELRLLTMFCEEYLGEITITQ